MMINPSQLEGNAYRKFGSDNVNINQEHKESLVLNKSVIELPARNSNYNCAILAYDLQYGNTYVIRFDDVEFTKGESSGVALFLYDTVIQEPIATKIFDVEYCRQNGGFEWIFNIPNDGENNLQLLLYSGLWKATSGIGSIYINVYLIRLN